MTSQLENELDIQPKRFLYVGKKCETQDKRDIDFLILTMPFWSRLSSAS